MIEHRNGRVFAIGQLAIDVNHHAHGMSVPRLPRRNAQRQACLAEARGCDARRRTKAE